MLTTMRHAADNLGNRRIDTGIKERIGDTSDDCTYISDLIAAVLSGAESESKSNQVNRVGGAADRG